MKSLKAQHSRLADAAAQLNILSGNGATHAPPVPFQQKLEGSGLFPLRPTGITTMQLNLGKMCNQVCRHCHVDAGPDRREIMTKETMIHCLEVLDQNPEIRIVDLTGGAPEMNPNFRWLVAEISRRGRQVLVRCNLTIILANKKYFDLPSFYREHGAQVISSLPFYTQDRTDRQRGNGVFTQSIRALQLLNEVGYGQEESNLLLHLVYNPAGAFLPPSQSALEKEYRQALWKEFGIVFNQLFAITNLPISRYLDYLLESNNYESYMARLTQAYNPSAAAHVMCREMISVGWDGFLYDCDFNQMLELKVHCHSRHISDFQAGDLLAREIMVGQHCYGCTAGAGSSCGGAVA